MSTVPVRNEQDRKQALLLVGRSKMPFSLHVTKGAPRSIEQNKLQRLWLNEAAAQGDQTAEEYRGYCKLHFGIPILRAENDAFREDYDRIIQPHSYEDKLKMMMLPIDFPVTRLMLSKQKTQYLDEMYKHFTGIGFRLTLPQDVFGSDWRAA